MESRKYTVAKVAGQFVGLLIHLSKSILFNIFIFFLGAAVGYVAIASKVHYYAELHDYKEYIQKIEEKVNEMAELDKIYTQKQNEAVEVMNQLRMKISHDQHHECDSKIGGLIFK